jgi:hypothetical protein
MPGKCRFGVPVELNLLLNAVVRRQLIRNDGSEIPELKTGRRVLLHFRSCREDKIPASPAGTEYRQGRRAELFDLRVIGS